MRLIACLLMFALLPAFSAAQEPAPKQEAAPKYELNVTGTLEIGPDGLVRSYELESKQSAAITTLIKSAVARWRFVPILDLLKPVIARTKMQLQLEAVPSGDRYLLEVQRVRFGQADRIADGPTIRYPDAAWNAGVGAKVMLALQLDNQGKVTKAAVLQTSLGGVAPSERIADDWRQLFEQAALDAVRHWHYHLTEIVAGNPVAVQELQPISFDMRGTSQQWKVLVPGPTHTIPWLRRSASMSANAGHAGNDEAIAMDSQFKLESDVIGKTL